MKAKYQLVGFLQIKVNGVVDTQSRGHEKVDLVYSFTRTDLNSTFHQANMKLFAAQRANKDLNAQEVMDLVADKPVQRSEHKCENWKQQCRILVLPKGFTPATAHELTVTCARAGGKSVAQRLALEMKSSIGDWVYLGTATIGHVSRRSVDRHARKGGRQRPTPIDALILAFGNMKEEVPFPTKFNGWHPVDGCRVFSATTPSPDFKRVAGQLVRTCSLAVEGLYLKSKAQYIFMYQHEANFTEEQKQEKEDLRKAVQFTSKEEEVCLPFLQKTVKWNGMPSDSTCNFKAKCQMQPCRSVQGGFDINEELFKARKQASQW